MSSMPLLGTHGDVTPSKKTGTSEGGLYTYWARMEIKPEWKKATLAAYEAAVRYTGKNNIEMIIAGAQNRKDWNGSRHLIETAEMVAPIFGKNIPIQEHPGAILPYLDLEEVFWNDFISIVEGHVLESFSEQDASTRQKITFKFLQALFEGKIEKWISIKIGGEVKTFFLPEEIRAKAAPDKIRDAQQKSKAENRENVGQLVEIIDKTKEGVLIILSKEQGHLISIEMWVIEEGIPKLENDTVYRLLSGTMLKIPG